MCFCENAGCEWKGLIAAGMKPGPEIGEMLERLLQMVLEEPGRNEKQELMEIVKEELRGVNV